MYYITEKRKYFFIYEYRLISSKVTQLLPKKRIDRFFNKSIFHNIDQVFVFFSVITNPKKAIGAKDSTHAFNFDFSYWSHDVSAQLFPFLLYL